MTGGYDPTATSADSSLIKAQVATYKQFGIDALLWPRNAGSYPGYVFTGEPLKLAAGHFGLGHGSGAHAPDEYYIIESANPKIQGFDGAVMSFVEYLYELESNDTGSRSRRPPQAGLQQFRFQIDLCAGESDRDRTGLFR